MNYQCDDSGYRSVEGRTDPSHPMWEHVLLGRHLEQSDILLELGRGQKHKIRLTPPSNYMMNTRTCISLEYCSTQENWFYIYIVKKVLAHIRALPARSDIRYTNHKFYTPVCS